VQPPPGRLLKCWTDDQKDRPERARRIKPERHRGDVRPPRAPRQPERHHRIDQVADEDSERRPWNHPRQDERPRELEDCHQQAYHQNHDADIVEHQAEERVDIAPLGPAVSLASRTRSCRLSFHHQSPRSAIVPARSSARFAASNANNPTRKYTPAVDPITSPRLNRSAANPTTVGAAKPPTQPSPFINPAATPRSSCRTTSKTDAKMFES